jgi:hypothetical protein
MEPPDSEESSGSGTFVHHPFMAMQAGGRVLSLFLLVGRGALPQTAATASLNKP